MKKESRLLLKKAADSLNLAIELFNRPSELGRISGVLIFLDHAFEMILKAAILHKNGKIRTKGERQSIGFDKCLRIGLTDGQIKFLNNEQVASLQIINNLRDAAQHHLLELTEDQLYLHAQTGVTLFRDLLQSVFSEDLISYLPSRVLPISVRPPKDLTLLFKNEFDQISAMLGPRQRKQTEAIAKLKSLAIMDSALGGNPSQPTDTELKKMARRIQEGITFDVLFSGVAAFQVKAKGFGPAIELRIAKKGNIPVHIVPEGTPGASVIAVKRVNELEFYKYGLRELAQKFNTSEAKLIHLIKTHVIQTDQDAFRLIGIGKTKFKRYSDKAVEKIQEIIKNESVNELWARRKSI